jgi:hypothetical protein
MATGVATYGYSCGYKIIHKDTYVEKNSKARMIRFSGSVMERFENALEKKRGRELDFAGLLTHDAFLNFLENIKYERTEHV